METQDFLYQKVLLSLVLLAIYNSIFLILYYKALKNSFFKSEFGSTPIKKNDNTLKKLRSIDHSSMTLETLIVSGSAGLLYPFLGTWVDSFYEGPYYLVIYGSVFGAFLIGFHFILMKVIKPIMIRRISNSKS